MNELLLLGQAAVSTLVVLVIWRYARERLYGVIGLFLVLISTVGGKIIEVFGHLTNTGNIFYAALYLATYFLIERLGKREGIKSIWIGVVSVAFFFVFTQMTISFISASPTADLSAALETAFSPFSKLALASLVAYIVSQNINVYLYVYLKHRLKGSYIWLRANVCNLIAQFVDSLIFFSIAFAGVVQAENVADIIMTGLVIKVLYVAVASPLLMLNRVEADDDAESSTISLR